MVRQILHISISDKLSRCL